MWQNPLVSTFYLSQKLATPLAYAHLLIFAILVSHEANAFNSCTSSAHHQNALGFGDLFSDFLDFSQPLIICA